MAEKQSLNVAPPQHYGTVTMHSEPFRPSYRRWIRTYALSMLCVLFLNIWLFPRIFPRIFPESSSPPTSTGSPTPAEDGKSLVPLEAHIMSKCPDAQDCLVDLVVPAMEKVVDQVDFKLSFIGTMGSDDTVQCMHGPDECLGNILALCAQELFPHDAKRSLGFTTCMINDYADIPKRDLVERCSLEHGISFEDINGCVSEEGKGLDLLEQSIKRTADAGVTKSCTVRVNEKIWCIRDGGEWKGCEDGSEPGDLVEAVKKAQNSA